MTKIANEIRKAEPILGKHRPKDLRAGWITCGVNTLGIDKHLIARANGRNDIGTMDRNYLADPDTKGTFIDVSQGIHEAMRESA
jgi:hypothetical protein